MAKFSIDETFRKESSCNRVMIVDDLPFDVFPMAELISMEHNAIVEIYTVATEAYDALNSDIRYDSIIFDYNLARTGIQNGEWWKNKIEKDIPLYKDKISIVTAYPIVDGSINKVFAVSKLNDIIKSHIQNRGLI